MASELFNHATLDALFQYWNKKRGVRAMPTRQDIDPIEMGPKLLPHLMLCEIADHGERIRFRLVGTSLVKRLGFDPTGRLLSELPKSDYLDLLGKLLRHAYVEASPLYGEGTFRWGTKGQLDARHLLLPLTAKGGGEPTIILVSAAYSSDDVFPPQIKALAGLAKLTSGKPEVLKLTPQPAWQEMKPANVA